VLLVFFRRVLALSDAIAEVSRGQLEHADDAAPVMFSATDRPLPVPAYGLIGGARQRGRSIGARTGRLDAAARRLGLAGYGHNDLSRPHGSPMQIRRLPQDLAATVAPRGAVVGNLASRRLMLLQQPINPL